MESYAGRGVGRGRGQPFADIVTMNNVGSRGRGSGGTSVSAPMQMRAIGGRGRRLVPQTLDMNGLSIGNSSGDGIQSGEQSHTEAVATTSTSTIEKASTDKCPQGGGGDTKIGSRAKHGSMNGETSSVIRMVNGKPETSTPKPTGPSWKDITVLMKQAEEEKWRNIPPIKKDFYREDAEISKMTDDEIENYRLSRNNISVHDLNGCNRKPMKPIKNFEHAFKDYPGILEQLRRQNFKEPSPIQSQVWPIALSGHDVIGIAQTGTGKTLAFLLPIFIHLDNQPSPREQRNGPGCIILSPTRELALQIHSEVKKYDYKGITSVCIYGGGSRREQVNICTRGVDIVIATPGRLNDLVRTEVINLKTVTFLVLDEADRMLDMGFEPQIKKVLVDVRPDRHTIMTSATWPELVRELGDRYTKDAFLVYVGSLDLSATHTVTQRIIILEEDDKMGCLFEFLRQMKANEKVIIFVGKKNLADHLSSELICKGVECQSMHGDRDQGDREQALLDIKRGRVKILVATDLASRGLDIEDITHVFNYDFPRNIEEYVHRVGRTGRAGRSGTSVTLLTKSDWRHSTDLVKILEEANQDVPYKLRQMSERFEQKKLERPFPRRW